MALPTLRPYYLSARSSSSSRSVAEKLMVQKRNQNEQFRDQWSENSRYFRKSDLDSSKQNQWISHHDNVNLSSSRSA